VFSDCNRIKIEHRTPLIAKLCKTVHQRVYQLDHCLAFLLISETVQAISNGHKIMLECQLSCFTIAITSRMNFFQYSGVAGICF